MKRVFLSLLISASCAVGFAQDALPPVPEVPDTFNKINIPADSIFIITNQDAMLRNAAFANCFAPCDTNKDGVVTYAEAAATTELLLSYGGRKNIIGDYGFLKFFPNLVRLDVGNSPVEEIDLSNNPKLEELYLYSALWVKHIKLAKRCYPRIFYPDMEGDFTVTIVP